ELFGVWGAVLAAPLAGLIQALLVAIWQNWRETHPEQFDSEEEAVAAPDAPAQIVAPEKEEILE
ncbi:MAG TPA: AI-2E family transporter, partial [Ktedonobacteraceae bacterium]|nr:AI-2E family transporter [Ktedonobacteraceae bacterium]